MGAKKANKTSFKKGHPYLSNNGKLKGKHNSPKTEFKKGKEHPRFKDGLAGKRGQYKRVQINKKRVNLSHKIFCEFHNIASVPKGFVIHHIDENKDNNSIENLMMLSKSKHSKLHAGKLKS